MILSIIIPMYNAEDYIGICLDSLLKQDLSINTYEIIVVNDGSRDRSQGIVEQYQKKYSNIILYNQENSGIGAARNMGINLAKGKYIYFIDSDDYVATGVFKSLLDVLEANNLDILGFNTKYTSSSNHKISDDFSQKINSFNMHPINGITFIGDYNFGAEVWRYIIKREFYINTGIFFYKDRYVQGTYITPHLLIKAERVLYLPVDIHRYRKNDKSITNTKTPEHLKKHINDMLFSIEKVNNIIESITNIKAIKRLRRRQQGYVFFLIIRFTKSDMSFNEFNRILKKIKSFNSYPLNDFLGQEYNGFKYYILVYIFNHKLLLFPFLFFYRIFYKMFIRNNILKTD